MSALSIKNKMTFLGKMWHKLFRCPTFWRLKPFFHCPVCGKGYRCYWGGNDCGGLIDVCNECAKDIAKIETRIEARLRVEASVGTMSKAFGALGEAVGSTTISMRDFNRIAREVAPDGPPVACKSHWLFQRR